jgi:hypothetical protein
VEWGRQSISRGVGVMILVSKCSLDQGLLNGVGLRTNE